MQLWKNDIDKKQKGAVLFGELLGYAAGAVSKFLTDSVLKKPKAAVDRFVAKHLILPHLDFYRKTFKAFTPKLRRADHGENMTDEAKADYIAGGMTSVLFANAVGFAASYGGQHVVERHHVANGFPGVVTCEKDKRISFVGDAIGHIGTMVLQSTVLGEQTEIATGAISKILQKTTGMKKSSADNLAFSTTWIGGPEIGGTLGRFVGHHFATRGMHNGSGPTP